jgi:hypothetical protein
MSDISYPIFIYHIDGSLDEVIVSPNYTIGQLKLIISTKKNIPLRGMELIFKGKYLRNDECLEYLGVYLYTQIRLISQNDNILH